MNDITEAQTPQAGFERVSDAMVYDIARHTASVLSSILLNRKNDAADDAERDHWAARRRLVKQQIRALDADDRAGLIAQDEVWRLEKLALTGTE
ncbi:MULTISPECIES: hypothetical protein [Microbacteriaceae]|uniref:hypothetical protein n=1 Tax=Microbacteriaceae TaxID=85023 RepID=UPI00342DA1AF